MSRYPSSTPAWGGASALPASQAPAESRAEFLKKTYSHVAMAVMGLIGLELFYFAVIPQQALENIAGFMLGGWIWIGVIAAFAVVSWIATKWAHQGEGTGLAYGGLALYTFAQSIILLPLLVLATMIGQAGQDASTFGLITTAAVITGLIVLGLTAFVFMTGANFNWLGGIIAVGVLGMFGLFGASLIFGFTLGIAFIVFGVVLMSASVLYQTSNIMHEYPVGSHVAASLALFASIAALFFYVLQLLILLQGDE